MTFAAPIPLIFSLSSLLLSINRSTISYNCPTVASYKLVSAILVSVPNFNIVAAVNSVVAGAFSGMLLSYCSSLL